MPTQKPRINLTLASETHALLGNIAQETQQSVASLAKDLILEALAYREDLALSTLAQIRSIESKKLSSRSRKRHFKKYD